MIRPSSAFEIAFALSLAGHAAVWAGVRALDASGLGAAGTAAKEIAFRGADRRAEPFGVDLLPNAPAASEKQVRPRSPQKTILRTAPSGPPPSRPRIDRSEALAFEQQVRSGGAQAAPPTGGSRVDAGTAEAGALGVSAWYPRLSRLLREEGRVLLEIGADRTPRVLESSGFERLDRAASAALARALAEGTVDAERAPRIAFIFSLKSRTAF